MALRTAPRQASNPSNLRLDRRVFMHLVLWLPLLAAFYGFSRRLIVQPTFPPALSEEAPRGRILASDGTILAEGSADTRIYPQGNLAAHIVGFSGALQNEESGLYGLEGLELTHETTLKSGQDIVTTIDPNLQAVAQAKLAEVITSVKAENGSVVMLEAGTGRIVAAASYPDFDPNTQGSVRNRDRMVNKAFMRQFEPGSVMKPFVIASLLAEGRVSLGEYIDTPMQYKEGDKLFRDVTKHDPQLTPWDILRYSSNSGMLALTKRFSDAELRRWLWHFGFGQDVDLGGTYTRVGRLRDTPWVPQDQASITIGQSMSTTALQLAAAYSIFANDGVYIAPFLVEGSAKQPAYRIIPPEIALSVRALLKYTAEKSGIGNYAIPGISLAGKTGTADIFDVQKKAYIKDDYTVTFVGMMPAENPRFTMVVTVQKPRTDTSSTTVAVPLFTSIASEAVALWQLPTSPETYATNQ